MKIYFLSENKTDNPGITAEHGLSIYIESNEMNILFDTGASGMFAANAKTMGIDLKEADVCVLSHGHYDHTEGVPFFCRLNDKADIILHKDAFIKTYGYNPDGSLEDETTGIRWSESDLEHIKERIVFTDKELWLSDNIVVSGTIHKVEGYVPTESFYEIDNEGNLTADEMNHEQFLAIRQGDGVFVFSGCSHRGVVPVLRHAIELFPGCSIKGLAAGMHLYSASDEDRKRVVDEVISLNMDMVMPCHCTGIKAICDLKAGLGDRCIVATAGDCYEY